MPRSLNISLGTNDYEWRKAALDLLADDVITDQEAGQRGAKLSVMMQMLAAAATSNYGETVRLMREIKAVAMNPNENLQDALADAFNRRHKSR